MRADFDGLGSDVCSRPPELVTGNGKAVYEHGEKMLGGEYNDGLVTVKYRGTVTESYGILHADLVIVADGASSRIHQALQPILKQKYAGYLAWRGTAPENEVSEGTKAVFACKTTFFTYKERVIHHSVGSSSKPLGS